MADGDLLIGIGNGLRGDDGGGLALAAWARRRWPDLRVRRVQQLMPELSCELALARRVLFVDAWWAGGAEVVQQSCSQPVSEPSDRGAAALSLARRSAPLLLPLRPVGAADAASTEIGAFSHRLEPAELLAITALLHDGVPQAWLLLVPAFRFGHGAVLSAELQAQLPAAQALLRQWCTGHA